jgi:hypothetical protein
VIIYWKYEGQGSDIGNKALWTNPDSVGFEVFTAVTLKGDINRRSLLVCLCGACWFLRLLKAILSSNTQGYSCRTTHRKLPEDNNTLSNPRLHTDIAHLRMKSKLCYDRR